MNHDDRIEKLLRESLHRSGDGGADAEPSRDLWPEVLRKIDSESAAPAAVPWYDWALGAGLLAAALLFPAAIPVFLYYL